MSDVVQDKDKVAQGQEEQNVEAEAEAEAKARTMTAAERMAERRAKLKALTKKRQEARTLNHREVVEEDRRNKEPKNMEARKRRAEYLLQEEEEKARCEREGKDFNRERLRRVQADDAEATERKKRGKINPDVGFSSFEAATARKYNSLVKQVRALLSTVDLVLTMTHCVKCIQKTMLS